MKSLHYLADNALELGKAVGADPVTETRSFEALDLFEGGEMGSKAAIEEAVKLVRVS